MAVKPIVDLSRAWAFEIPWDAWDAEDGFVIGELCANTEYEVEIVATSPDGYERRAWHTITIRPV